jgi:MFS family permease
MRTIARQGGTAGNLRTFAVFACAYAVSAYGTYLNLVALSLYTFDLTGSALGTGALMALRLASGFLSGVPAGRLAARFDGRTLMVAADLAQAAAMVALLLVPGVATLAAAGVVLGAGNAVFTVALRSSVPELVGHERRTRANGFLVTGRSAGTVLGFASAGLIIPIGGYPAVFLINAASFVVSAVTLLLSPLRTKPTGGATDAPRPKIRVVRGLSVVLLGMLAVRAADALGSASHNVGLPIFAEGAGGVAFMSQFMTAWAVGSLVAHPIVARWTKRTGKALGEPAFALGTGVMSVSFVLAFTGLPTALLIAVAVAAGLADGFTEICYVSRLQELPAEQRGPLFGLSTSLETTGFGTGMLLAGILLEVLPVLAVVGLLHGIAFVLAASFLLLLVRRMLR